MLSTLESVPSLVASRALSSSEIVNATYTTAISAVVKSALTTVPHFIGEVKTMFQWGASGLADPNWKPPKSIIGTSNMPKGIPHLAMVLVLFTACWCLMTFILRKAYPARTDAYISRVVSLVHCVISFVFSGYCCYLRYQQIGSFSNYWRTFTCLAEPPLADEQYNGLISASYFIMDTFGILFGTYFDPLFILHHVGAIIILLAGVFTGSIGPEIAAGLFLLEGSNPLMHTRWLLQAEKFDIHYPDSFTWKFVNRGFYVMFILMRQVIGTLSAYNFGMCAWVPWFSRLIGVAYWVFSLKFLIDILGKDRAGERWMQ